MTDEEIRWGPFDTGRRRPLPLVMQRLWLTGQVAPTGARLFVDHTFRTDRHDRAEVVYSFVLPRDAAMRRFRVTAEEFSVRSELRLATEARQAYERGITRGQLSALATQHEDGLVNLALGNLRGGETVSVRLEIIAGVDVRDDGLRLRFPFTLAPSYHPNARAAVVGDRLEIELPDDVFDDVLLPPIQTDSDGLHEVGFDLAVHMASAITEVASPSHAIRIAQSGTSARVSLASSADAPDRDLVLDVRVARDVPGVVAGLDRQGTVRFAAVAPSTAFGALERGPRRAVILLDRSGSMSGRPIAQARRAVEACLGGLTEHDEFALVAFDNRLLTFRGGLVTASAEHRNGARLFLDSIDARGGTELAAAIAHAARILGGPGEIMVITDGEVFGTGDVLERARALGIRIHCLGIGAASQDRFLTLLARETGGTARFLTSRERVDRAAVDLFAAIGRPLATAVTVSGISPAPPPSTVVFAGTPLVVQGSCEPGAVLHIGWDGGAIDLPVTVAADVSGELLRLLQGARLLTDAEARVPSQLGWGRQRGRDRDLADAILQALSEEYGLASRAMALVAVLERRGDVVGQLPHTTVVPVGLPQDMDMDVDMGGIAAGAATHVVLHRMPVDIDDDDILADDDDLGDVDLLDDAPRSIEGLPRMTRFGRAPSRATEHELADELLDPLVALAATVEPDGGLPGVDLDERLLRSIAALLAFLADGGTVDSGPFRVHVRRLVQFLADQTPDIRGAVVAAVLEAVRRGRAVPGSWLPTAAVTWQDVERALDIT